MLADFETLRIIWWILICVLLIGFAIFDGFDFGVLLVAPIIGKTDEEIRVCLNSIAPHWDGNQVWLLLGGGAIFAAWPQVYAASFSGFYVAMILVLALLYFRPVGLEYRAKLEHNAAKKAIDYALAATGFGVPLVIGVAFGNLLLGVPFQFNEILQVQYGNPEEIFILNLLRLLNPFSIVAGLVSLGMITLQGLTWLQMKTTDDLYLRVKTLTKYVALFTLAVFVVAAIWVQFVDGYRIVDVNYAISDPTKKEVIIEAGAWLTNYNNYPVLWLVPVLSIVSLLLVVCFSKKDKNGLAFVFSSLNIATTFLTCAISLFPFVMPSSTHPDHSLTIWDSTATAYTLNVMFIVALIFVPIILSYTAWCYFKMYGRIKTSDIVENSNSLY